MKENDNNTVFSISAEQLEEIREKARKKVLGKVHEWRQRGDWLVCISCEHQHAVWVGHDKVYKGKDKNGNLIFEELKIKKVAKHS